MKKQLTIFSTGAFILFCCFSMLLTLSSKDKNDPGPPDPDVCSASNQTRQLAINFESPNTANQFRTTGFSGHIPTPDMRNGNNPGVHVSEKNKWHCKITITSPQCSDFRYEWVLENSDNVVNVTVPSEADFIIYVLYSETFDSPYNAFDFNIDALGSNPNCIGFSQKLIWQAEEYYLSSWNAGISQPITLSPSYLQCEIDPNGIDIGKNFFPSDYESANDFILDNYPNSN